MLASADHSKSEVTSQKHRNRRPLGLIKLRTYRGSLPGARERGERPYLVSEPSSAFETQIKHGAKEGDNAYDNIIAVLRLQLGHVLEIHAVNPRNRGGYG